MHHAWWVLVGICITIGLGKGALTGSAGLFLPSISKELHIGVGNLTIYLSIAAVITLVFLPIGGKMMEIYNTRVLMSIAILLQAGAFVAFGFMHQVWGWYIFALPLAVGGTFITVIAGPVLISRWFKKKNGLALGILGAAGGLMGVIAQPIVGRLIAVQGWRTGYIALGIGVIVVAIPTILLLLRRKPEDLGLLPYGVQEADSDEQEGRAAVTPEEQGVSMAAARKSPAFYSLAVFFFSITSIASFAVHIPTYMTNQGYSIAFSGKLMGIYMIGVLLGSLAMGVSIDKIGSQKTAYSSILLGILSVLMLIFLPGNPIFAALGTALFGFTASNAINTLAPSLVSSIFGYRNYSQIYSTVSLGLAVASIIALPAYGYVFDFVGSYKPVLGAIIVMMAVNFALVMLAYRGKEKLIRDGEWN